MTNTAVALTIVSAAGHAYWNLLIKRAGSSHALVGLSKMTEGLLMLPILALASPVDLGTNWLFPVVGAAFVIGNYLLMTLAYRHGDFSTTYPIARGVILAMVPPLAFIVLGERLEMAAIAGICTISAAIFLLQMERNHLSISPRGVLYASGAAACAAIYTVWDKQAVSVLSPITYFAAYTALVGLLYGLSFLATTTQFLIDAWRTQKAVAARVALLNAASYVLLLVALQQGNASNVIALRQVSIALGALCAWKLLGERLSVQRCAGIALMVAGCFMVALEAQPNAIQANAPLEIAISNGNVRLAGHLYLPPGPGPFPAMVFTHGSAPSGRDSGRYQEEARYFASQGIVCLIFDKRGYGDSTGDWRNASFEDLAGDAVAAVSHLTTRPEVQRDRIGLRGASQSGWLIPIAASRSPSVAFVVLISPAGVTPFEQVLYDTRTDLEDAGFSPVEVESALRVTRSALNYARTGHGWDAHAKEVQAAKGKAWLDIAAGPPDRDHWLWKWMRLVMDFDVMPIVKEMKLPTLVLLGERDRVVPAEVAGYLFERAFKGHPNTAIRYFPDGDHDLRSTTAASTGGRAPFVSGYLEMVRDWARGHY
jgi:drug/metabolite transporter (DMT)-like permease/pimeloyl-ACP methyl ester carboxylesterase